MSARAVASAGLDPGGGPGGGTSAQEIARLSWLLVGVGTAIVVLVVGLIAVALRRPSSAPPDARRSPADGERDERRATAWVTVGGVVLPAAVIAVVLVATVAVMRSLEREAATDAPTVEVTGHQWWWEVRYPDEGVVTANEIHIPVGSPVRLELRSADVVHSFWVPDLAGKLDLVPERVNELVIDADRPGRYLGRCAEFCGLQHANMDVVVVAHDEAGFRRWIDEQSSPAAGPEGPVADGLGTFLDRGCATCHTIAGTAARGRGGPDLTHVASREFIAGGLLEPVVPDLRSWIEDPHAVKPGVLMPDTALTPDEIELLVGYLETLR